MQQPILVSYLDWLDRLELVYYAFDNDFYFDVLWWLSDVWSRMSPFILAHALEFVYSTLGVFSCISTFTCFHWLCCVCFGLTQFISVKLHVLTLVILYIFMCHLCLICSSYVLSVCEMKKTRGRTLRKSGEQGLHSNQAM